MIEHEYTSTTTSTMFSVSDTVCPNCRHSFTASPATQHPGGGGTTSLQHYNYCPPAYSCPPQETTEPPPAPPPRLKPVTYANVPATTSINTSPNTSTKSYVTMSNLNLHLSTTTAPSFIPLNSPSGSDHETESTLFGADSSAINCNNFLPTTNNRVYRQLSGGGLIESPCEEFRIIETHPMHRMSGGGLINTKKSLDETLFSLPEQKSTKFLISTPSVASISISPCTTSSSISIVVPKSISTSLEISSNTINITVPRTPPALDPAPSFLRRNLSRKQIKRAAQLKQTLPVDDMTCLSQTIQCLQESGWFHEGLSWNASETLLSGSPNGTFVVRESSNPNFLFAITVQTEQQPTSVRIVYDNGRFRLDCVSHVTSIVPQFDCVVELIEYYVTKHNPHSVVDNVPARSNQFLGNQVFVDENGHINSVVSLRRPLRSAVPSLMHCARLAVNKRLKDCTQYNKYQLSELLAQLELPKMLKVYLIQYPYTL